MENVINFLSSIDFVAWIAAIGGVVTAASVIVQMTPTQVDDNVLAKIQKVLNFLALNWGNDKKPTA